MKPIITSRWETDAYKFSMGQIFWLLFRSVTGRYVFVDRNKMRYIPGMVKRLREQVQMVADLPAHIDRAYYMKRIWPWMNWEFLEWFANHKFDPKQVVIWVENGMINIIIHGPIYEITYWEIFLLRIYSALYTEMSGRLPKPGYEAEAEQKARYFFEHGILWVEGGGRRAFSPETHWQVLTKATKYMNTEKGGGGLLGTSWVEYAFQLGLMQFGTQAHEFTSFMGAQFGHDVANAKALEIWVKTYGTKLGYALPDTYGLEDFRKAFSFGYADLFTGMRHDFGPAIPFVEWVLNDVYGSKLIGINPANKYIVHSNSIKSPEEADTLNQYRPKDYMRSFLIGGSFTNDFGWDPYNTVIKLWSIDRNRNIRFAIKVPDDMAKAVGDPATIEMVLKSQGRL